MSKFNLDVEVLTKRYEKIKEYINRTPLIHAVKLSALSGNDVYIKLENLQKAGSFKIRGALSKMMTMDKEQLAKGVVAASAGNHSQGVSYAANLLGCKATIVMPATAPIAKINATKNYGSEVILEGNFFDDAQNKANEIVKATGKSLVHAFDDIDVVIGQASIGIEVFEDIKDADYVLVPVGGGGILSGIAAYIKQVSPKTKLIGVESESVPSYYEARKTGKPYQIKGKLSIADGIAVKQTGAINFEILNQYVDDVVLVTEDEIAQTILFLFENCKIVAEGAGAVTSAAILFNKLNVKNKKIVCILTGGNIDVTSFLSITNRALIAQNRRVVLRVDIPTSKGHLSALTAIIANNHVQAYEISASQFENELSINREIVKLVLEINEKAELSAIIKDIDAAGYTVLDRDCIEKMCK